MGWLDYIESHNLQKLGKTEKSLHKKQFSFFWFSVEGWNVNNASYWTEFHAFALYVYHFIQVNLIESKSFLRPKIVAINLLKLGDATLDWRWLFKVIYFDKTTCMVSSLQQFFTIKYFKQIEKWDF